MGNELELQKQKEALAQSYKRKVDSVRSRTRGRLGEVMAASIFPREIRDGVLYDNAVFETPWGSRRVDNFMEKTRQAVESKFTRVVASRRIREQIAKDRYLLDQGVFSEVVWVLFYGGSKKLLALLQENNIRVVGSWDELMYDITGKVILHRKE